MDLDFKDKAIFIGLSERLRPEQKDGFYTTFSQPSGVDISGVEIAATAFANLLEDMPVRQLSLVAHLVVILFWGMLVGSICRLFPTI
jgi:adenylate cyclase